MKPKIFAFYLTTTIMLLFGFSLFGATRMSSQKTPKYTDKVTALRLAKILDKGTFGRYTISSAYVQNNNINEYYISVILSDGSVQKWYINDIYKWSRDDRLLLSKNRALLFLDPTDSRFVILDKNKFHRLALMSKVFVKVYGANDPLEGKEFHYQLKTFSLISPTETAFGRNESGSKYRYIIDLYNGTRELLTYEKAYILMMKKHLLQDIDPAVDTFKGAYQVSKILPYPKGEPENGVSQFGVEIQFSQAIKLKGYQFPFEIYERKTYNRRTRKSLKQFVIDITIPNSEKRYEIRPISNLEYLQNTKIVKDPKFPKRLLLRTTFSPQVMDIPPVIYKNSENSVYITFFNLVDQTILNRGMLLQAQKRKNAEMESAKRIKITKAIKKDSEYGKAFIAAMEIHKQSQAIKEPLDRINKLLSGIKQFEQAALYAEKDSQLYNALAKRNQLKGLIIVLTVDYVKTELSKNEVTAENAQRLFSLLEQSEAFSRKKQVLRDIESLKEQLNAIQ